MRDAETVVRELRARGELWEAAPGLVGLRGDVLALRRTLEHALAGAAGADAAEEWAPPPALSLETLARADYFASFPQWLTLAAHLGDDAGALERVARSHDPAAAARSACAPADAALPPAVCYHVYAGLAGQVIGGARTIAVRGTCWRHEGDRLRALARGWAFTMCEGVCVGDEASVTSFRERGMARGVQLAASLGLDAELADATDPFFAPTARGRGALQRIKGLKRELLLRVGGERIAAASFNLHEGFFGDAFDIRLASGAPAASGCVAYGEERWLLAFLAAHGTRAAGWPPVPHAQVGAVAA